MTNIYGCGGGEGEAGGRGDYHDINPGMRSNFRPVKFSLNSEFINYRNRFNCPSVGLINITIL